MEGVLVSAKDGGFELTPRGERRAGRYGSRARAWSPANTSSEPGDRLQASTAAKSIDVPAERLAGPISSAAR